MKYALLLGTLTSTFVLIIMSLLLLILSGCGDNYLIREGVYDVTGTLSVTTDPLSENFHSQWIVQQKDNDGKYRLTLNRTTQLNGSDVDGQAKFSLVENISSNDNCPFFCNLNVELTPNEAGFTGNVSSAYTWCTRYDAETETISLQDDNTEYFVVGKLK